MVGRSQTEPVWDVAIVGAGPAGASAALSALHARPDARVLLLDRSGFPRDKSCGDGIAPHVMDVLSSIGITGIEAGYAAVDRLQIGFASGPTVRGVMVRPAYVIPREVFDDRLVQAAVERGAQLRRHRVRTVLSADEAGPLVLDGSIRARVVIAADGAYSTIRRQVAPPRIRGSTWPPDSPRLWRSMSKPPGSGDAHTAVAIRGYAPVAPSRSAEQVIVFSDPHRRRGHDTGRDPNGARDRDAGREPDFPERNAARDPVGAGASPGSHGPTWPAYAWSFPIGDGRANIGYGELLHPGRPLTRQHLLERLEALLPGATADAGNWLAHHLPLSTGRPRQSDGPVLFVGDAMSLINPVTGEGIFYAVTSGVLAGQAAVSTSDAGRVYRSALRRAIGVHLRHTDAATLLTRWPAVVAAAVRAADQTAKVFDDLVELGLGDGRLTGSALRRIGAGLLS